MSKRVIGIDLGSTFSCVSTIENGKPTIIVNDEGTSTTPSVISLKEGNPKVGNGAKRQMIMTPNETIYLVKRFMGGTYSEVEHAVEHVTYKVVNDNGKARIVVNDRKYSPEELSAMIITKMKNIAEDYLGETVTDAVITVPAFFSDAAKSATKQAGELAGLNVLRIISEPTAALLASNIDKKKGGKFVVVDYGGATLDFSVADISDDVVEILASYGDVYCGGSDIDKKLAYYLVDRLKENSGVDIKEDKMAMSRIFEAAEKAKIELSASGSTEVNLPYITSSEGQPIHFVETVTRAKFEQLISELIEHVVECGRRAVERSGVAINDLDGVLLVGGSCRIPLLQQELIKAFGDKLIKSANLDLAVAEGAAIQADILANGGGEILLLDVCPLSVGIETEGGVMTTLIEANTTIPCRKEQIFTTAADNQTAVTINVLQGERPLARDNKQIGVFNLDGIAPARRGVPQILVKFDIDANGILSVTATDKATGKEQNITIQNDNTLSKEEIERIKREAEEHAAEDAKTRERIDKLNKLDSTIAQVEKTIEDFEGKNDILTEEDKSYLNGKVEELKTLRDGDLSGVDTIISDVEKRLMTIGAKAYGQNNANPQGSPFGFDPTQFSDMFMKGAKPSGDTNTSKPKEDFEEVS